MKIVNLSREQKKILSNKIKRIMTLDALIIAGHLMDKVDNPKSLSSAMLAFVQMQIEQGNLILKERTE